MQGNVMENNQLEPDILINNLPEDVIKGEDPQLKRAVEELLK
jgi:C-terminal processing protease CtpA/Prc